MCLVRLTKRCFFILFILFAGFLYFITLNNFSIQIKFNNFINKKQMHQFEPAFLVNKVVQYISYRFEGPFKKTEPILNTKLTSRNIMRRLPDALIFGVKKCGTRALLEFIRLHPKVKAAGSEVHFFDKYYYKGFEWYRQKMPLTSEDQITMEKTPSYWVTKSAPKRVYLMNPNIKLIAVVRDPVTRAISDYTQTASKHHFLSLFEQLAFLNKTVLKNNISTVGEVIVDSSWSPVRLGIYVKPFKRWMRRFPRDQILLVSGERLISNPTAEMDRVQKFLNLPHVIGPRNFYLNSTKGFPCIIKSEKSIKHHCLGRNKGRNHPLVSAWAIDLLKKFYEPYNRKFEELSGEEFGWN